MSHDWNPEISLGGLISNLSFKMRKQTREDLIKGGLEHISFPRFWVMYHLHKSPMNQASLCGILSQKPPSMMEMLQRLEAEKLVRSKASPTDSRKKMWSLTPKGKRDYLKAQEIVRNVGRRMDRFFAKRGISEGEVGRIREVLGELDRKHFEA